MSNFNKEKIYKNPYQRRKEHAEELEKYSIENLETMNPQDHHTENFTSTKYDNKKEKEIYKGLQMLSAINGEHSINKLLLLLAKWWEVKPARANIKKAIEQEAIEKGYEPINYFQNILGKEIEKFTQMQLAVDRLRVAKTFFKPRNEKRIKGRLITIRVENKLYNVYDTILERCRNEANNDHNRLKTLLQPHLIAVDTIVEF